jgi:hypothetical protein
MWREGARRLGLASLTADDPSLEHYQAREEAAGPRDKRRRVESEQGLDLKWAGRGC